MAVRGIRRKSEGERDIVEGVPISVIIPAYNAQCFLSAAIQSVLDQTYSAFELLIIDDASTDGTEQIARRFADRDLRVRYYRNATNSGVAYSRNFGVFLSRYDWIAFLDGDDLWRQDKLERQSALLRDGSVDVIYTGYHFLNAAGERIDVTFHVPACVTYWQLLKQNVISCSGVLLRKSWCQRFPMELDSAHEDFLNWLRILRGGAVAVGIDLPLHTVRIGRRDSKSGKKLRSAAANIRTYRILGLSVFRTTYYMFCYSWRSLRKYGRIYTADRTWRRRHV